MARNVVISVFGRKGSGKSTLVREIVDEAPRVIVFDTMGEYARKRDKIFDTFESAASELGRVQHERRFRVIIQLVDEEDALAAMRVAYDVPACLIVVEETSFYCSPSYLPMELARFVRYGRHREIDQIYVSRRPAEIHRDLTAQSDLIVSFQQHEPGDVEYLRKVMGPDADRLPGLPKYAIIVSGDVADAPLPILERLAGQKGTPKLKPGKNVPEKKDVDEESDADLE
jgi:hypothetical protein